MLRHGPAISFSTNPKISISMSVPRKGSLLLNYREDQFRWNAKGKENRTLVKVQLSEVPDGQMLVGWAPRVFTHLMVETLIDAGLANGWNPLAPRPPLLFTYRQRRWLCDDAEFS